MSTCDDMQPEGLWDEPVFRLVGDRGLLMELSTTINRQTRQKLRALCASLEICAPVGVVEVIPTYCSLIVAYDPLKTGPEPVERYLRALSERLEKSEAPEPRVVEVPVCYGGDFGEDLDYVASHNGLSPEEVIRIHSGTLYPVYMLGFTPGFPYLGGLSEKIHAPRLATPRTRVPAGSVGIANNQTGIYPIESPGGWQLIGRCPLRLFDLNRRNPFYIKAGDLLRFIPISLEAFASFDAGEVRA
ncbi:5-oxoprolinase subunit PxpB [Desulfoluna sp.]|uniref:5-oxoprolinase subunit PxpB n=1 Tax=Desulfoluna sp. TaxID=2045199 RepID=UPI00260CA54C|nr:5-oxoprolinase subunit PxpB [Desulfoluna sp.]